MKPVLYILMRTDLASMNPGKAMAQASHASNAFVHQMRKTKTAADRELFDAWENCTEQGFGTCIVLDAISEDGINQILYDAVRNGINTHGIVLDPTYPVQDGGVTHYIPVNTCGYVFTDVEKWRPNKSWSLHK